MRLSVTNTSAAPAAVRVEEPLAADRHALFASRGWAREGGVVSWLRRLEPGETCRLRLRHAAPVRGGR